MGSLRRFPLVFVFLLAGAVGLFVPIATGSHGDAIWAGKWLTTTGTLRLSVPSAQQLARPLWLASCIWSAFITKGAA